jgi:hypothetical protein
LKAANFLVLPFSAAPLRSLFAVFFCRFWFHCRACADASGDEVGESRRR